MADTNFSQWNPAAANQENDSNFQGDSQRSGGAVSGPFQPSLANKLFYQNSTMVRALAVALVSKGYSPKDGTAPYSADASSNAAVNSLAAVLGNIVTNNDLAAILAPYLASAGYAANLAMPGYIKLPASLGGLIVQWAAGSVEAPPGGHSDNDYTVQTIDWNLAFPTSCLIALVSTAIIGVTTSDLWYQTTSWTTAHVSVLRARSHNDAGREGDYNASTQPYVLGIGK